MFKSFLLNRLKEPSTYVGLVAIIGGAFGVALSDEHALNIASGVALLVGALLAAHREAKSPDSAPALRADVERVRHDAAGVRGDGYTASGDLPPEDEGATKQRPIGGARDVYRNRNKP